jgi:hypothetical protein
MHRWVVAQIDGWDAIEGKVVMHACDNPACYRYDHLRIGTQADNTRDMDSKGRRRTKPSPGSKHGLSKLTEADIPVIRQRAAAGEGPTAIAADYPVNKSNISQIIKRKTWTHV